MTRMLQCVVTVTLIDLNETTLRPSGPPRQEQIVLKYEELDLLSRKVDQMEGTKTPAP